MGKTTIEWTDFSVSPIRARHKDTGKVFHFCEKISPGCAHCYAATMAQRFGLPDYVKANRDQVEFFLDESKLLSVLKRKKPTRYFWEDCSDLFGDWVPDAWIDRCFAVMALTQQHTHQVLTKRPERMRAYFAAGIRRRIAKAVVEILGSGCVTDYLEDACAERILWTKEGDRLTPCDVKPWPLPNIWLGVSVEDQQRKGRIDVLRQTPAAVRFLSLEPLLEDLGELDLTGIHWAIIGGESGGKARRMDSQWVLSIISQCAAAGTARFFKQAGSVLAREWDCTDPKGGDLEEIPESFRVSEFPQ